ncbi:MAG: hypothetical protein GWM98_22140 [Nitrospinaceae bacterium]|nr:hypothetical protein [Nitrospinaceae bacterium]NIR56658.1 hypothetical protein [Nitrospinaceae bacterium]NIS87121.1 hypothetical protein [Nitrospinaceae bacterium]NIT83975.1 hypothetical protein [Nitrospinaceae bacterium]NIU46165.1 hypothetical protein [Nitrospinaceae bacterium]
MKQKLSHRVRLTVASIILCVLTIGVLFTGPGFGFAWQVLLGSLLLFFLFWFVT